MRIYPDKKGFLVLDYGGNIERHGCIDDPDIQFSELKPKKKGEAPVKQCPNCGLMVHTKTRECPECKYKFPFSNKNKASLKELLSINQNNVLKIEWFAPSIKEKNDKKFVQLSLGSMTRDVSIFFFFDHTNFARRNSILLWAKFFGSPVPTNTQECYDFLLRIKDKPKYAQIVKNGKYYNVINLFKEDPNEIQRESSNDERTLE
jgi:DNA repair protein RadD